VLIDANSGNGVVASAGLVSESVSMFLPAGEGPQFVKLLNDNVEEAKLYKTN